MRPTASIKTVDDPFMMESPGRPKPPVAAAEGTHGGSRYSPYPKRRGPGWQDGPPTWGTIVTVPFLFYPGSWPGGVHQRRGPLTVGLLRSLKGRFQAECHAPDRKTAEPVEVSNGIPHSLSGGLGATRPRSPIIPQEASSGRCCAIPAPAPRARPLQLLAVDAVVVMEPGPRVAPVPPQPDDQRDEATKATSRVPNGALMIGIVLPSPGARSRQA